MSCWHQHKTAIPAANNVSRACFPGEEIISVVEMRPPGSRIGTSADVLLSGKKKEKKAGILQV